LLSLLQPFSLWRGCTYATMTFNSGQHVLLLGVIAVYFSNKKHAFVRFLFYFLVFIYLQQSHRNNAIDKLTDV